MGKKGVGRPRDGNPEETRREILRAAERSFAAAGFVGATTRQVASAAGVNVATLHYHFGNKEGLYRAVLREAGGGPLPAVPSDVEAGERLRRVVVGLFDHAAAHRSLPRLALLDRLAGPRTAAGAAGAAHAAAAAAQAAHAGHEAHEAGAPDAHGEADAVPAPRAAHLPGRDGSEPAVLSGGSGTGEAADARVPLVAEAVAACLDADGSRAAEADFLARWIVGMIDVSLLSAEAADGGHPAPDVRAAVAAAALSALEALGAPGTAPSPRKS